MSSATPCYNVLPIWRAVYERVFAIGMAYANSASPK